MVVEIRMLRSGRSNSLECGATPPQRGCRAGDPGCRRFGPWRLGATLEGQKS
jgi:hypothetical protein